MWRSLGWLFVNGCHPVEANRIFYSDLLPVRTVGNRREVWLDDTANLEELKAAAKFIKNAKSYTRREE
jgi:hypothetical protein